MTPAGTTLLALRPGFGLVQAGTPGDVGTIHDVKTFIVDLATGELRRVAAGWPQIFDLRGDLVLVDAGEDFPQLAVYRRQPAGQ